MLKNSKGKQHPMGRDRHWGSNDHVLSMLGSRHHYLLELDRLLLLASSLCPVSTLSFPVTLHLMLITLTPIRFPTTRRWTCRASLRFSAFFYHHYHLRTFLLYHQFNYTFYFLFLPALIAPSFPLRSAAIAHHKTTRLKKPLPQIQSNGHHS